MASTWVVKLQEHAGALEVLDKNEQTYSCKRQLCTCCLISGSTLTSRAVATGRR